MTGADAHLEGFSWLYAADPALGQHASVKESIARPIGQLEETKSLFKAEPFNSSADWRSGRCLEPSLAEARSRSECAGLSGVGVSVEVATPRIYGNLDVSLVPNRVVRDRLRRAARNALSRSS